MPSQENRRVAFSDRFSALVGESRLSTRDIARRSRVSKSAISDWQHAKSLPQVTSQLEDVLKVLIPAEQSANLRPITHELTRMLREAKEERDADSVRHPARATPRDPELRAERRARAASAAATAKRALMSLRNLGTMPDWQFELAATCIAGGTGNPPDRRYRRARSSRGIWPR